jgi:hypothetical protein
MVSGTCSVCGENKELRAGMCIPHYNASWRQKMALVECRIEGCKRGVKCRMMCETHYKRTRGREKLEKELALKEKKRREQEIISNIRMDERKKIIHALRSEICLDCGRGGSIHRKCYGLKDALSILTKLGV